MFNKLHGCLFSKSPAAAVLAAAAVALVLSAVSSPNLPAQERPREEVTVTVVEVPVRVLLKGQAVRDLAKDDFEVLENGVPQKITQFQVVSRKIAAAAVPPALQPESGARPAKRLFLLIFNIFDYNKSVGEAVDYFFRDIFRAGDQVVVMTEGRVLDIPKGKGGGELAEEVKGSLLKYKAISTAVAIKNFRDITFEAEQLLAQLRGLEGALSSIAPAMIKFFQNYQRIWEEYRRQFLVPDLDFYQGLITRLRGVEGDKWAIAFQQREMFPKIRKASFLENEIRGWADSQLEPQQQLEARLVQARQAELQRSFDFTGTLKSSTLSDIFISADFTFHVVLMKSSRTVFSQDLELKEVGQDYEEALTRISRATGGSLAFSNLPAEALKQAAELEDYHYILVYSPAETSGAKKREIKVRVNRSGVEVATLENYRGGGPRPVAIADFKLSGKTVSFTVRNCQTTMVEGKRRGIASVKITIYDQGSNKVFDEGKTLDLTKDELNISLNFGWLGPGDYFIIVEAVDLVAKATDVYSGQIKL